EPGHPLGPRLAKAVVADERVVPDDTHAEPKCAAGNLLPDPPEAEHAERLAADLDPAPARALPPALLQGGVGLRDVARERDQEPDRLLRGRDDGGVRRVCHDNAAVSGGVQIDVVDSNPGPADHFQPAGALD